MKSRANHPPFLKGGRGDFEAVKGLKLARDELFETDRKEKV
jgi:hypothetical protein